MTGRVSTKPLPLRAYAGGNPSCCDSQLQNSAASSQLTWVTGWLSRSIDWRSM